MRNSEDNKHKDVNSTRDYSTLMAEVEKTEEKLVVLDKSISKHRPHNRDGSILEKQSQLEYERLRNKSNMLVRKKHSLYKQLQDILLTKSKLKELKINGFKSINSEQKIRFNDINILIGSNGAGKSNLVSFFKLIEALTGGALQAYIGKQGYADSILHYGMKQTKLCGAQLLFTDNINIYDIFEFSLEHSYGGQMMFGHEEHEQNRVTTPIDQKFVPYFITGGHKESLMIEKHNDYRTYRLLKLLQGIKVFQFNNTSSDSAIRHPAALNDNRQLNSDASNLPSFLYQMKIREDRNPYYKRIVRRIAEIMPQFRDFDLRPMEENPNMIRLDWIDKHQGHTFGAHQISDGSLRFMALATLLLQPKETLPKIIVIDEPELGLHPEAMMDLVGMIQIAAANSQIILSTQSSFLMNLFEPEDIITVSAEKGYSEFIRLPNIEELKEWYGDYTLAELWEKNLIGGRR